MFPKIYSMKNHRMLVEKHFVMEYPFWQWQSLKSRHATRPKRSRITALCTSLAAQRQLSKGLSPISNGRRPISNSRRANLALRRFVGFQTCWTTHVKIANSRRADIEIGGWGIDLSERIRLSLLSPQLPATTASPRFQFDFSTALMNPGYFPGTTGRLISA